MPFFDHHLAAGAVGGVITAGILHPIDLVKVRLQVQDGRAGTTRYRGIANAVRSIASTEGVLGFYRGVIPAMVGSGASWGLYFFFYESCKRRMTAAATSSHLDLETHPGMAKHQLSVWQNMYASWEAGTITCFFTNPIWLVKTRMQLQRDAPVAPVVSSAAHGNSAKHSPVAYRGMFHALRTIVLEEGPLGLYRGLVPALFLVSHGMVQFAVYEELKVAMSRAYGPSGSKSVSSAQLDSRTGQDRVSNGFTPEWWAHSVPQSTALFAAGAASKAVATTVTYPYQVIKSRIQQRHAGPENEHPYRGFLQTVRKIGANEGLRGFYRGFTANLLRVAPQSAVTLVAYEKALAAFNAMDRQ